VHSIYLVNLGKPFDQAQKDREAVVFDLLFGSKLEFEFVNTHLGKGAGKLEPKQVMKNMRQNLERILEQTKDLPSRPMFLRENTA